MACNSICARLVAAFGSIGGSWRSLWPERRTTLRSLQLRTAHRRHSNPITQTMASAVNGASVENMGNAANMEIAAATGRSAVRSSTFLTDRRKRACALRAIRLAWMQIAAHRHAASYRNDSVSYREAAKLRPMTVTGVESCRKCNSLRSQD